MAQLQVYLVSNTAGDSNFAVQPQTFNGPGGVQRSTDLTLYGNGTPNWGQEFNENFYRLHENWAVEAKVALNSSNPKDQPLSASDLGGVDIGINNPVRGQTWYNLSNGYLFVYTGSQWQPVSVISDNSAPSNPIGGVAWFDTSVSRYKIWSGSQWDTFVKLDGDTMTGTLTLNGDPSNPLEAATKQYVDNSTVAISGDTMTGTLTLNGDPSNPLEAATKQYVDNRQLNDLTDVNTSPSDGDLMTYSSGTGQWQQTSPEIFAMPPGVVFPYAGPSSQTPSGWMLCNGQQVSRSTYNELFNLIGETYGAGDGSTTFNLPDFRGEFLRGLDEGRGVDSGRTLGSYQSDEFRSHSHTLVGNDRQTNSQTLAPGLYADDPEQSANGGSIQSTGGNETRPRNIAVNYIIKT